MPLVFVHGIKTREGNEYRGKVQARDKLFRTITFARGTQDPGGLRILNPYWGRFGANFDFGHAYLPEGAYEEFGPGDDVFARIVNERAHGRLRRQQDPGDDRPEGDALRRSQLPLVGRSLRRPGRARPGQAPRGCGRPGRLRPQGVSVRPCEPEAPSG